MKFFPSRSYSLKQLEFFIQNNLNSYSFKRNYDFGPKNRGNVSCLSPYISHGVIQESEVINQILKQYSFLEVEKFIQEVLWKNYWKGWLELRPKLWRDFIKDTASLTDKYYDNQEYLKALEGKTNITCFNDWVNELRDYNYLHNHTRMWFASIWIFTLKLPWQLGAKFFLEHLLDGDPASNTLGWRWVAGIQTIGKHYLASSSNIEKFTNRKYTNLKVNETAEPITTEQSYNIEETNLENPSLEDIDEVIVFDNFLSIENNNLPNSNFKKIYLVENDNFNRSIKLGKKVLDFKNQLLLDQSERLKKNNINHDLIQIKDLHKLSEVSYIFYPNVGENLDFINKYIEPKSYIYRQTDQFLWKFCNKGFFNFKKHIPSIIKNIN